VSSVSTRSSWGSEGEEGNRFHALIADNDIETYLINTGSVGDADIGVEDTVGLLEAITRGTVDWEEDDMTGLDVPERVLGVDMDRFRPAEQVEDYEQRLRGLRREREEYLAGFEDLDDSIRDAVY